MLSSMQNFTSPNKKLVCLVVAPHHDDEVIGCGGLLIKLQQRGWRIIVVVVFDPLEGRHSNCGKQRLAESSRVAQKIGTVPYFHLKFPCRAEASDETIAWKIVKVLRRFHPTVVLMPHSDDRDPEHLKTHRAANEALWLSASGFKL